MKTKTRQFEWDGLIPVAFLLCMIVFTIVSL